MKQRKLLILSLAALLLLAPACGKKDEVLSDSEETNPAEEITSEEPTLAPIAGPCNNILHPLSLGNNWVYELDSIDENGNPTKIDYSWSVSESTDTGIVLGTLFYDSGTVVSANVDCSDGMIQNFPLTVSNIVLGDTEGSITYTFVSGKFLPSHRRT